MRVVAATGARIHHLETSFGLARRWDEAFAALDVTLVRTATVEGLPLVAAR